MAAAEAEGRNLLLPVDDAEVRAASLDCCVSPRRAMREATMPCVAKQHTCGCISPMCVRIVWCCAGLRAVPALGARERVQAWYARVLLSVSPLFLAASKRLVHAAGDCIHLFHVVTHDTARSLECFSRPMEEDLPPEYHQEMLVRFFAAQPQGLARYLCPKLCTTPRL